MESPADPEPPTETLTTNEPPNPAPEPDTSSAKQKTDHTNPEDTQNTTSDDLDYDVPQNSERIIAIVEEAKQTINEPFQIPDSATAIDADVEKNDPRLWETKDAGSCTLYTNFYVIYRDPYLKNLFHSRTRRDSENYYFYMRVSEQWYTFRIPTQVIQDEKAHDKNMLYPTDWEFLLAVSVLCQAVMYMKVEFVDRLAYQPFIDTDLFFDREYFLLGSAHATIALVDGEHFTLTTDSHTIDLAADGTITVQGGGTYTGHYALTVGFTPKGFTFGHASSVYFSRDARRWIYYSTFNDPKYDRPGESFIADIAPMDFNSVCILSGAP